MPKISQDEMIIDMWNNYRAETKKESEKFLEILEKVLTKQNK